MLGKWPAQSWALAPAQLPLGFGIGFWKTQLGTESLDIYNLHLSPLGRGPVQACDRPLFLLLLYLPLVSKHHYIDFMLAYRIRNLQYLPLGEGLLAPMYGAWPLARPSLLQVQLESKQ